MEVRKDGPASRAQLAAVAKSNPTFIERYQLFCTAAQAARLKESSDQGMDMHTYIEFKALFKSVIRVHRETLNKIRDLWRLMLKNDPKARRVEAAVFELNGIVDRTNRIYRK